MSDRTPDEPPTAPEHDRWYNLTLGPTFKDDSANRLSSLRYEFKPASIDKSRPGSMHKRKDNRVSVEFQNNQPGKPKVVFEGSSEDYKENEAVLIFDGHSFRLERLHRVVKQLRHVRLPGDGAASVSALATTPESRLSPVIKPGKAAQQYAKPIPPAVPVEVERIDVGEPAISVAKSTGQVTPPVHSYAPPPLKSSEPPNDKKWDAQDTLMEDLFGSDDTAAEKENAPSNKTDAATEAHIPHQNDSDDEIIADVDDDDDDDDTTRGLTAADALKMTKAKSSSSSSSSGTSSSSSSESDSGSASSSSRDSEGSDVNSV